MPKARSLRYEIDPPALRPSALTGDDLVIDTDSLAVVATQELSQTSPVIMGLGLAIHGLLKPGDAQWRWSDSGPGIGREVRRAMSGLFGRFVARWYLSTHHGVRAFIPIDTDSFTFQPYKGGPSFRIRRRPGHRGDVPDWVWTARPSLAAGEPRAGFLEAKGTYYRNQIGRSLSGAHTQLKQLTIEYRPSQSAAWTTLRTKGWAIATGWSTAATIKRGFMDPLLRVEDPQSEGDEWPGDAATTFYLGLRRLQIAQCLTGLGARTRTQQVLQGMTLTAISEPADAGRRSALWRIDVPEFGAREVVGVEVRPLYSDDGPTFVAGIDIAAIEALAASSDPALATGAADIEPEFVLAPRSQSVEISRGSA